MFYCVLIDKRKPTKGVGDWEVVVTIADKDQMSKFLLELNNLTFKYGIYISTLLDENGLTKDSPYLIHIEEKTRYSGYQLDTESGEIVFVQC